jgi:tetratricopeptide (TPR) repeat protein
MAAAAGARGPRKRRCRVVEELSRDLTGLQRSPGDLARWQRAQRQVLAGSHALALAAYQDLVQRYPEAAQLWFELGLAAAGELEFNLADRAFGRTMELAPKDVTLLILIAQQFQRLRRLDQAQRCFELAVAVDPSSLPALLSLAAWREKSRQLDAAWECVETCLARHPRDVQAGCLRALLLHRKGRHSEAETLLRDLARRESADPQERASVRALLAEVLDEQGQYAEAMRWLLEAKANARLTANVERMERDYDRADRRRRELLAALSPRLVEAWRREPPPYPFPAQLTLLGGHPRSGTTLLEEVLGAHPQIQAFDEPEAFVTEIWNPLAPMDSARGLPLEELDRLSARRRAEMRRRYFKSLLREHNEVPSARIFLVKDPSPTAALHLWLRVFPELKVIIALRDPRDVVISCFFQNLTLTSTNVNFLSLERSAKHYADLMDVWLRMRELNAFDWIQVRYRDVVADLRSEGARATEFLGLTWNESQVRFHEAAQRKFLFAPTYSDVTRPLHDRAVGRWRNYREALQPVLARLAPYCREFGYTAE